MKRLSVNFTVHVGVSQKDLCRATLGDYGQHSRFLKLFDGLGRKDHRRSVLAPSLLRLHYVTANRLVLDEEPRFVEQKHLESGELLRVRNLIRCPMQDVKQQWFQNLGRVVPAVKVEGLKA